MPLLTFEEFIQAKRLLTGNFVEKPITLSQRGEYNDPRRYRIITRSKRADRDHIAYNHYIELEKHITRGCDAPKVIEIIHRKGFPPTDLAKAKEEGDPNRYKGKPRFKGIDQAELLEATVNPGRFNYSQFLTHLEQTLKKQPDWLDKFRADYLKKKGHLTYAMGHSPVSRPPAQRLAGPIVSPGTLGVAINAMKLESPLKRHRPAAETEADEVYVPRRLFSKRSNSGVQGGPEELSRILSDISHTVDLLTGG